MVASAFLPNLNRAVRLGRIRPKAPPQVLRLRNYLTAPTTPPPAAVEYHAKAAASIRRVYMNDQLGCCVISGKHHAIGVWTGNESSAPSVATDQEVYQQYQTICGPGDNGCVITDVLDYFKARGLTESGTTHRIDGYVAIDTTNRLEVQTALYLFGAVTLGINLPGAWANDAKEGAVWDVTNSGTVGGHDVTAVGYDPVGVQVATWGLVVTITWAALASRAHVEEGYAILAPDWYASGRLAPCGVRADELAADLAKLAGGEIPPLPQPPAPPPPIPPPAPPPPPVPPWVTLLEEFLAWLRSRAG